MQFNQQKNKTGFFMKSVMQHTKIYKGINEAYIYIDIEFLY